MRDYLSIKQKLYQACQLFIAERFKIIKYVIDANQVALASETKSSAGDKHETGRAMLQLKMEKVSLQLKSVIAMQETLSKLNLEKLDKKISLGSLVVTDKTNYFLAISAGKITIDKNDYYAVSPHSPIGKSLLGNQIGAVVSFDNTQILNVY